MSRIFTVILFLFCSISYGQYNYVFHASPGKNPGGLNQDSEFPLGSGLDTNWVLVQGPSFSQPSWSSIQNLPFGFEMGGLTFNSYRVSTNGILSFDLSGPTFSNFYPPNSALPSNYIPNYSAVVWGLEGTGSNDNIVSKTFGNAPNRQHWVMFNSYSSQGTTWAYWSIVLEESTNKIYFVDQRTNDNTHLTVGVQINGSNFLQTLNSPNVDTYTDNLSDTSDNAYYEFIPIASNSSISGINQPTDFNFNWQIGFIGEEEAEVSDLALDNLGNNIISGIWDGSNSMEGITIVDSNNTTLKDTALSNDLEGFITSLDSNGTINWLTTFSSLGSNLDVVGKITTDNSNNIYFSGTSNAASLIINGSSQTLGNSSGNKRFIGKLNSNGALQWINLIKGGTIEHLECNANGDLYFSGNFSDSLIIGNNSYFGDKSFIGKYSTTGNFQWLKTTTGFANGSFSFSVDSTGDIYSVGMVMEDSLAFGNSVLPDPNGMGTNKIILSQINSSGNVSGENIISRTPQFYPFSQIKSVGVGSNNVYFYYQLGSIYTPQGDTLSSSSGGSYPNAVICQISKTGGFQNFLRIRAEENFAPGEIKVRSNEVLFTGIGHGKVIFTSSLSNNSVSLGSETPFGLNWNSTNWLAFGRLQADLTPIKIGKRFLKLSSQDHQGIIDGNENKTVIGGIFENTAQLKGDNFGPVIQGGSSSKYHGFIAQFGKPNQNTQNNTPKISSGDTIFYFDFANGLPSNWSNIGSDSAALWEYRGPNTNPSDTIGSRGAFVGTGGPINSSSRSNGFMIFDSDFLDNSGINGNFGLGASPAPHMSTLYTGTLDFSGEGIVVLEMNSYFRTFASAAEILISYDGGLTFPDVIPLHADLEINQSNSNSEVVRLDLSSQLGYQPNVVLGFRFNGNNPLGYNASAFSYYYWMLDDIKFLRVKKPELQAIDLRVSVPNAIGYHWAVPYSQYNGVERKVKIANSGIGTGVNVKSLMRVLRFDGASAFKIDSSIAEVFSDSDAFLISGDTTVELNFPLFEINDIDRYMFHAGVTAKNQEYSFSEKYRTKTFEISENEYRLHRYATNLIGTSTFSGITDSLELLNHFPFPYQDQVTSIEVRIGNGTEVGGIIIPRIWKQSSLGGYNRYFNGSAHVITAQDTLNESITFPINKVLSPGNYYIGVSVNSQNGSNHVMVVDDGLSFQESMAGALIYQNSLYNNGNAYNITVFVQPYQDVTFQVDMQNETVSANGVFLEYLDSLGNIQDTALTSFGNDIYGITLQMPFDSTLSYRFRNGLTDHEAAFDTCFSIASTGDTLRSFYTGPGKDTIPLVCFNSCNSCLIPPPPVFANTFRVNMRDESISANGVYLEYLDYFNNIQDTLLTNFGGDTFGVTLQLDSGRKFLYRFRNGLSSSEFIPGNCDTISSNNFRARNHQVIQNNDTLNAFCFEACEECPGTFPIHVQVDMRNEIVDPSGVYVYFRVNGVWYDSLMTNSSGSIYTATVYADTSVNFDYRFYNGSNPENTSGSCFGIFPPRRIYQDPFPNDTLPLVCFDYCTSCPPKYNITATVDMQFETVDPAGVHLYFRVNGVWYDSLMTNIGGSKYQATVLADSAANFDYRFYNGSAPENNFGSCFGLFPQRRIHQSPQSNDTLPEVCFSYCEACPKKVPITAVVDMQNETVDSSGVYMRYWINNVPYDTLMSPLSGTQYYATVLADSGNLFEYRFYNGNDPELWKIACMSFYSERRQWQNVSANDTIPDVCFSYCNSCVPRHTVVARVDMANEVIDSTGVFVKYQLNGVWITDTMINYQGFKYYAEFEVDSGVTFDYRFLNGSVEEPNTIGNCYTFYYRDRSYTSQVDVDTIPLVCYSSCEACGPQFNATFVVDMQNETIDTSGVYFSYWTGIYYDTLPMVNYTADKYAVTLLVDSGFPTHYKFLNGNIGEVVPPSCRGNFQQNREFIATQPNDTTAMVCFDYCVPCTPKFNLTLQVDMRDQFIDPSGVNLRYWVNSIQYDTLMINTAGSIYEVTVTADSGLDFHYRFINGTSQESIPFSCFNGTHNSRIYPNVQKDDTLGPVCFASCFSCPPKKPITFRVEMKNENISPQGVYLEYEYKGILKDTLMANLSGDKYIATVLADSGSTFNYRYRNGLNGTDFIPLSCYSNDFGGTREVVITSSLDTLPIVCFSKCTYCNTQYLAVAKLNMQNENVDTAGVFLQYELGGVLIDTIMTQITTDLYEGYVLVDSGATLYYRFRNGLSQSENIPNACSISAYGGVREELINQPKNLPTVCFGSCVDCAPIYNVTLTVDMQNVNIDSNGVFAEYIFQGVIYDTLMSNTISNIYQVTIPADSGSFARYRFRNGLTQSEQNLVGCNYQSLLGNSRRYFVNSDNDTISKVCFDKCQNCVPQTPITVQVDMSNEVISGQGVFLDYWFEGALVDTQMINLQNDIFIATVMADSGANFYYRFRNGASVQEIVPFNCNASGPLGNSRREFIAIPNDTVGVVCFSSCFNCLNAPPTYAQTFRVNMKNENISPQGIFMEWEDATLNLTDTSLVNFGNDVYGITFLMDSGSTFNFRFRNGFTHEVVPANCRNVTFSGDTTRQWIALNPNDTTLAYCFESCANCLQPAPTYNVDFRVNMYYEQVDPAGVFMEYYDSNQVLVDTLLANISTDIYAVTLPVDSGETFYYRFRNGLSTVESIPNACNTITNQGDTMRVGVPNSPNATFGPVCFSKCVNCKPPTTYDILFEVDMENQALFSNVFLNYLALGNTLTDVPMTNTTGNKYEVTLTVDSGFPIYYRFKRDFIFEDVPYSCNTYDSLANFTRSIVALKDDTVSFCYELCTECNPPLPCTVGPAGTITGPTSYCQGDLEVAFAVPPVFGAEYNVWFIASGNQTIAAGQGTNVIRINMDNPGAFTLGVYGSDGNCNGDTSYINLPSPAPPTDFTLVVSQQPNCGDSSGVLFASPFLGGAPYSFDWTTGDSTQTAAGLNAGIYEVTVTSGAGCQATKSIQLISSSAPTLTHTTIQPSCAGFSDGSIDLTISGGTPPFNVKWLTGQTTEDISNLEAGGYFVEVEDDTGCVVFDCIELLEPAPLAIQAFTLNPASCTNQNGAIQTLVTGGTGNKTYNWSNAASTSQINNLDGGVYSLTVTDANSCTKDTSFALSDQGGPQIILDSLFHTECNQSTASIYVTIRNSESPTFNWSTGDTTEDVENIPSGLHYMALQDSNCATGIVVKVNEARPQTVELCMVTVDDTTQNNILVWDKTLADSLTTGFNVYRESCQEDQFIFIGTNSIADQSEYQDLNSNSAAKSWKYKISSIDNCGNESYLSPFHKTIHAKSLGDTANGVLVGWNPYVGFNSSWYYVERYTPQTGWVLLDSVPTSTLNYIDVSPQTQGSDIEYSVYSNHPFGCLSIEKNKNYNSSRSNRSSIPIDTSSGGGGNPNDTTITDTTGDTSGNIYAQMTIPNLNSLTVYPNPANQVLNMVFYFAEKTEMNIYLMDVKGQMVIRRKFVFESGISERKIELLEPPSGIYSLVFETNTGIIRKPIVISH